MWQRATRPARSHPGASIPLVLSHQVETGSHEGMSLPRPLGAYLSAYHGRCMFSKRTDWKLTPNRFTEVQRELHATGREVFDLTVSNPTRAGLHYDAEAILKSLSSSLAMDYDPQPKGLASARE